MDKNVALKILHCIKFLCANALIRARITWLIYWLSCGLDKWGIGIHLLSQAQNISLLQSIQMYFLIFVGYQWLLPWVVRWSHHETNHSCPRLRMRGAKCVLPCMFTWLAYMQFHLYFLPLLLNAVPHFAFACAVECVHLLPVFSAHITMQCGQFVCIQSQGFLLAMFLNI